ncbi:MAG: thermonuclease family protein [Acidimicrobiia bacterium]|nr:thermonuclease family protein [Acidimicrobiia bacterium]
MVRIIDGDTIVVGMDGHEYRVRLIGIDTPETHHPSRPVECYGPEATAHIHTLIPEGSEVWLERDEELWDLYGRILAYVYRAGDDLFVNAAMVEGGYATTLVIPPNTAHTATFAAAERAASEAGMGLWSACDHVG